MNWFERNFRKLSINNLTLYLILGKLICFAIQYIDMDIYMNLMYDAEAIMHGEVWRFLTYLFVTDSGPLFLVFELMFFYWVGNSLEQEWGSLRYTMYILSSIAGVAVATVLGYLLGIEGLMATASIPTLFFMCLFLPFAWYWGDEPIRIMFIFTTKIKYLAIIDLVGIGLMFLLATPAEWLVYIFSMLNMIVFFAVTFARRGKQKARYAKFHQKVAKAERQQKKTTMHRCTICGITEKDDPDMTFRYCSKCYGDHEYCEKHLTDHEHITNVVEFPQK